MGLDALGLAAVDQLLTAQRTVIECRMPAGFKDPGLGKYLMRRLISSLRQAVPDGLEEVGALARPLTERSADILAYFDHPGSSNGPTEAINGRLEHLRGIALGFRNLTHYTIRSLIHAGRLKDHLTATT